MLKQCTIPGCNRWDTLRRGWCEVHWDHWKRNGDPLANNLPSPEERFWSRVDPCRTDGCWLFSAVDHYGYGKISLNGKYTKAHHFLIGPPPKGLQYDHVKARGCTHKNCVNPDHLEAVTARVNVLRSMSPTALQAAKTHCVHGHEFTPENTYHRPDKPDSRMCRECIRIRNRLVSQRRPRKTERRWVR